MNTCAQQSSKKELFKGIVFDFNGVLFWDSHLHEKAWRDFSIVLRETPVSSEEIFTHVHGRPNKYVMEYLLNRSITSQESITLSHQKESLYRELCLQTPEDFQLSPGAIDLFDFLITRDIPFTIATASGGDNLAFFIKHLKLDKWFDLSQIVYDDGSFTGKQGMYLKAADNLKLKPQECVVIEDAHSGITAAHNANIGKIIALGPMGDHERLLSIQGVSQVVTSLDKIEKEKIFGVS